MATVGGIYIYIYFYINTILFQYLGSQHSHTCSGCNNVAVPFDSADGGISQQQQSM